jgi:hypothetical protein
MADLLIILGPCKRKENSHFAENGDPGPLAGNKKVKPTLKSTMEHITRHQETFAQLDLQHGNEHDARAALTMQQAYPPK